jgi:GWxTD domain-containing protein
MMKIECRHITIAISAIALLVFQSCGTNNATQTSNIPEAYKSVDTKIKTDYKVFHLNPKTSRIFVKLHTDNLLYARSEDNELSAGVTVTFNFNSLPGVSTHEVPTKTIRILDKDEAKEPKVLLAHVNIDVPTGYTYKVDAIVRDINRGNQTTKEFTVNKIDLDVRQNFLVTASSFQTPVLSDRIVADTTYRILVNTASSDTIVVHYYNREFKAPPPPFIESIHPKFDYTPDSSFYLVKDLDSQISFKSKSEGFYHFLQDPSQRQGLTLFISHEDFPEVRSVEDLIEPFRYVLKGSEFKQISETPPRERKAQLEQFWIDWVGDRDRARKALKAYYERVENANTFFSSHNEGWKTDRGMMYIVFGEPNKVYRDPNKETWIYGEENNPMSLSFDFVKVINPFTDNDYRLIRQDTYKAAYTRSVGAWRDGRVY